MKNELLITSVSLPPLWLQLSHHWETELTHHHPLPKCGHLLPICKPSTVTTTTLLKENFHRVIMTSQLWWPSYDDHSTGRKSSKNLLIAWKTCLRQPLSYDDHLGQPCSYDDLVLKTILLEENSNTFVNYLTKLVYDNHWVTTTTQDDHPVTTTTLLKENFNKFVNYIKKLFYDDHWVMTITWDNQVVTTN